MPLSVVGVLPEYYHLYVGIRRAFERIENIVHIGIYPARAILLRKKHAQSLVAFALKILFQQFVPIVSYVYHITLFSINPL